ncbi:hypothetical protein [Spirosoma fluminis]
MKTLMMKGDYLSSRQLDSEEVENENPTSQSQASHETPPEEEDNADVESNTLGGTSDTGAGPAVGDGQPAEPNE